MCESPGREEEGSTDITSFQKRDVWCDGRDIPLDEEPEPFREEWESL